MKNAETNIIHENGFAELQAEQTDLNRFKHHAMATIFEIVIDHNDPQYASEAAQAGFEEIDRLEKELSRFQESSDISKINSLKQFESTTVSLDTFECLKSVERIYQDTKGAFDVTAGPVIDLWKSQPENKPAPSASEVKFRLDKTGFPWLRLDQETFQVQVLSDSISIDLGGTGKGYALDRVVGILKEWEIPAAFIHGGQSSVLAYSNDPDRVSWPISIRQANIYMKIDGFSLSGSGMQKGQHIIDPRTGYPVENYSAVWASAPSAVISDALSTAFMVMSVDEIKAVCKNNREVGVLMVHEKQENLPLIFGRWPETE